MFLSKEHDVEQCNMLFITLDEFACKEPIINEHNGFTVQLKSLDPYIKPYIRLSVAQPG